MKVQLNDELVKSYKPVRAFTQSATEKAFVLPSPSISLDFEPTIGHFLIANHGHINKLTLLNANSGEIIQRCSNVYSNTGAFITKFTKRHAELLLAPYISEAQASGCEIQTYSLSQKSAIRSYFGHSKQVLSISQSPFDDGFASSDVGGEMRIWDPRNGHNPCIAVAPSNQLTSQRCETFVTYHPSGSILASADSISGKIRLYSIKNLQAGPFQLLESWSNTHSDEREIVDIKFSPDGSIILITTNQNNLIGIGTQEERVLYTCECVSTSSQPAVPAFSCDSKYFFVNGPSGPLIFSGMTGEFIHEIQSGNAIKVSQISCFSPKTELLVTSGEDAMVFWRLM